MCSTFVPLDVKLAFTFNMRFFVPSIVFVTDMVCVTSFPLLPPATETGIVVDVGGFISMVTYFGTATCRCRPYSGSLVVFMNLATRTEFCLFHVSGLVHLNSTDRPWCVNPCTITSDVDGPLLDGCAGINDGAGVVPNKSITAAELFIVAAGVVAAGANKSFVLIGVAAIATGG